MTDYNPLDEMEQLPPLTELQEQQEWNQDLLKRIQSQKSDLIKLKEIEESFKTFGFLSYEETTIKNKVPIKGVIICPITRPSFITKLIPSVLPGKP